MESYSDSYEDDEVFTEDPSPPCTSTTVSLIDTATLDSTAGPPEEVTESTLTVITDNGTAGVGTTTSSSTAALVTPDHQDNVVTEPTEPAIDTTATAADTVTDASCPTTESDVGNGGSVESSSPEEASPIDPSLSLADKPKSVDPPAGRLALSQRIFPGIGKVFALPSELACDVDAYVGGGAGGVRRDPSNEEDDDGDHDDYDIHNYPTFPSNVTASTGFSDDLEANASSASPNHSLGHHQAPTPPLDANTDPFAPRVGKTLLWRNVNMTLVSCCCPASLVWSLGAF
jgi:hypothetical protein